MSAGCLYMYVLGPLKTRLQREREGSRPGVRGSPILSQDTEESEISKSKASPTACSLEELQTVIPMGPEIRVGSWCPVEAGE